MWHFLSLLPSTTGSSFGQLFPTNDPLTKTIASSSNERKNYCSLSLCLCSRIINCRCLWEIRFTSSTSLAPSWVPRFLSSVSSSCFLPTTSSWVVDIELWDMWRDIRATLRWRVWLKVSCIHWNNHVVKPLLNLLDLAFNAVMDALVMLKRAIQII